VEILIRALLIMALKIEPSATLIAEVIACVVCVEPAVAPHFFLCLLPRFSYSTNEGRFYCYFARDSYIHMYAPHTPDLYLCF